MTVFLDTSGLYAAADATDSAHPRCKGTIEELLAGDDSLVTTNYVVVELVALLANRLGMRAVRWFHEEVLPAIVIEWVDREDHTTAQAAYLAANRRRLSLVDCVSFHVMRRLGLDVAFTTDPHFREQGFRVVP